MFEFLNKVFGRPVEVEVVGYESKEVVLKSEAPLTLGINDVHATIAGVKLKARIQVVETGIESSRGFWLAPTEAVPYLEEIFTHNEKRRAPRYARALRVRSALFDKFQGSSLDLSIEGMRLEGQGNLVPGSTIEIDVELDDHRETRVEFQAVVRWSAPALTDGYVVSGLEYLNFDETNENYPFYLKFLERLAASEEPLSETE